MIFKKCFDLNRHNNIKNNTTLFANKNDKYKKKDLKKITK